MVSGSSANGVFARHQLAELSASLGARLLPAPLLDHKPECISFAESRKTYVGVSCLADIWQNHVECLFAGKAACGTAGQSP